MSLPIGVCFIASVVELGHLWIARVELKNALEAAALAGADEWGDTGVNNDARNRAVELAAANNVAGTPLTVAANGGGGDANGNNSCNGNVVILGQATATDFNANVPPGSIAERGVHVQATVTVSSILGSLFGVTYGPYNISGSATARANGTGQAMLISVTVNCP